MSLSKVISGVTAFLTTGAVGTGVSYFSSKATIGDMLEGEIIPVSLTYDSNGGNNVWDLIYTENKDSSDLPNSIKDGEEARKLADWCKLQRDIHYKDLFTPGNEENLKKVKKFCSVSIKSMLASGYGEENIIDKNFKNNKKEKEIWEKLKDLLEKKIDNKVVASDSSGFLEVLQEKESDIKENANKSGDFKTVNWESKYLNLCKKLLDKKFLGNEDRHYKEADIFCTVSKMYYSRYFSNGSD